MMRSFLSRIETRWAVYLQGLVRRSVVPVVQRQIDHIILHQWASAIATDPNPLLRAGAKYFSQFDEDGILLEILRRLKIEQGSFVEVGVGDGTENNTIVLLAHGWTGLWLGNQSLAWTPSGKRLRFEKTTVTPENVGALVGDRPVDVLSLDVDGNDYWIVKSLLARTRPRILVLEYNAKFPPPVRFVMPYDPNHGWDGTDYFGASLSAWQDLLAPFKYVPVCCSYTGLNVFFVSEGDLPAFADVTRDITRLYRPARYLNYVGSGHPVSPRTLAVLER